MRGLRPTSPSTTTAADRPSDVRLVVAGARAMVTCKKRNKRPTATSRAAISSRTAPTKYGPPLRADCCSGADHPDADEAAAAAAHMGADTKAAATSNAQRGPMVVRRANGLPLPLPLPEARALPARGETVMSGSLSATANAPAPVPAPVPAPARSPAAPRLLPRRRERLLQSLEMLLAVAHEVWVVGV